MRNPFEKALAFSILAAAVILQADAAEIKSNRVALDEVTVTATKTPIKVEEVPASVDIITSEDIGTKAGISNVFDALKSTPGFTSQSNTFGLGILDIRGYAPSFLINGMDSKHFAMDHTFDPNLVDMQAVERIEVLKGPQSTMHGGRAISGVVNVIMKKGDKNHPFLSMKTGFGSDKSL
ncbi:TonB-dependent receptor plug domain-containing protein [Campylobacter sp.]|uniref:TonB-dependent receptor plug domain-containing protein n=1 Tax=Campylobacter sp. TaxID=205 RepID=UPI0026F8AEFE|nr:TonB-dependent receptor plug domain-containing protein [Campylobacter sp.]